MGWLRRLLGRGDDGVERAGRELVDQYHDRASVRDGGEIVIAPGQVLDNIAVAMERVDLDVNTEISIDEDVVGTDELFTMVETLRMGPTVAVHVLNTGMRLMSARYPADLVGRPLPEQYDLRQLVPMDLSDHVHELARSLFNRRARTDRDLAETDIADELAPLNTPDQMSVFVALFCMFGTKVSAMKNVTGID